MCLFLCVCVCFPSNVCNDCPKMFPLPFSSLFGFLTAFPVLLCISLSHTLSEKHRLGILTLQCFQFVLNLLQLDKDCVAVHLSISEVFPCANANSLHYKTHSPELMPGTLPLFIHRTLFFITGQSGSSQFLSTLTSPTLLLSLMNSF